MTKSVPRKINWVKEAKHRAKSGHSLFGPSTLPRVFRCPGSVRLSIENNAKSRESEYALEGTRAHALAAEVLTRDVDVSDYVGSQYWHKVAEKKGDLFDVTQEMGDHLQKYVDRCRERPGQHFIETRASLEDDMQLVDQFGTADFVAIYHRTLDVTDLKYGEGEIVYAEENEQLLAYALAFYREWCDLFPIDTVILRICQPRLDHYDEWTCSVERLEEFARDLRAIVKEATGPDPRVVAGKKQCTFCPMGGQCSVQTAASHALLRGDFDSFDEPEAGEPRAMTDDELAQALEFKPFVKKWLAQITMRAMERVQAGCDIGGLKVVETRTHRQFKSFREAQRYLLEDCALPEASVIEEKLISPAKAEKLLSKEQKAGLADLVWQPPGKPTLAPQSDSRKPFQADLSEFDGFDELTDDDDLTD